MRIPELPKTFTPLTVLYEQHLAGDKAATDRLFFYFAERLSSLAQQYLKPQLTARVGGEDIVQSVMKSFLMRASAGQFRIENSQDMWNLLVTITIRKARQQVRRHTAERRDVDREVPQPAVGDLTIIDQLSDEPTAEEAAIYAELLDRLIQDKPPEYGRVLELRLADYSLREIAKELSLTKSAVEAIVNDLRHRLEKASKEEFIPNSQNSGEFSRQTSRNGN